MDDMTKNAIRELAAYVLQHGTVTERARKLSVFLLSQTGMSEEEIVKVPATSRRKAKGSSLSEWAEIINPKK